MELCVMFDRLMTMKSLTALISFHFDSDPQPQVPEPMSLFLAGPGLVGLAGVRQTPATRQERPRFSTGAMVGWNDGWKRVAEGKKQGVRKLPDPLIMFW